MLSHGGRQKIQKKLSLDNGVVGGGEMSHVDSFVDALLTSNHCCSVALPTLPPRHALERAEELPPRFK